MSKAIIQTHIIKSITAESGDYKAWMNVGVNLFGADYVIEITKNKHKDKLVIKDKDMLIAISKVINKYLESTQ